MTKGLMGLLNMIGLILSVEDERFLSSYLQLHRLQPSFFRVFKEILKQKKNNHCVRLSFRREVCVNKQQLELWHPLQQTNLQQQLVLHDPLDRLDEQVCDL